MGVVRRVIRNLIRNPLRTGGIVAILSVSIGLALIMFTVHGATANQLGSIGTEIGTEITIRSAGSYGTMGGGEPLAQEDVDKLSSIDHVDSVQVSVQTQYSGDSLESPVDAGSLGGRGPMGGSSSGSFTMPITVMGFSAANESPTLMNGTTMEIVEGSYFTSDDADVMVVGQDLADKNSLSVGSTVDIEGTSVTVIGIYDSGTSFGNNMLIMPVDIVNSLFDIDGVTSVTVVVDDIDNVDAVASDIREIFPEDVADVTTAEDMYARINDSLTNAGSTSTIGMIVLPALVTESFIRAY